MSNTDNKKWILAIDPGSDKVGYAVVNFDFTHGDLGIGYLPEMHRVFAKYCRDATNPPQFLVMGNGTKCGILCKLFNSLELDIDIKLGDEKNTTFMARSRYFEENPPTGLWKFVPKGMLFPPRPIDDYAALLIGEAYLKKNNLGEDLSEEK
ncbi:MAG: hypothetical protein IKO19_01040 [Candidatus Riflebacteria bacterium]|nr:hypothetical protein [Candidatus Riflebacteria bacterium]